MTDQKDAHGDIEDLAKITTQSHTTTDHMTLLPEAFASGPMDVICARGKRAFNHSGNQRFRAMIDSRLVEYSKATSKLEKSVIVSKVVNSVRGASPEGGFVKQKGGNWYEVGDHIAREKIGQRYVFVYGLSYCPFFIWRSKK
jgi:hypothetical protein